MGEATEEAIDLRILEKKNGDDGGLHWESEMDFQTASERCRSPGGRATIMTRSAQPSARPRMSTCPLVTRSCRRLGRTDGLGDR